MASTSLAHSHDLTREEIVSKFRDHVAAGERVKLTREERESLALLFVDRLVALNQAGEDSRERVEEICRGEKELLEEGYPVGSISSVYLPLYTKLVKAAIAAGRLGLNERNSYSKGWMKRDGSGSGVTQTHHALDFLVYDYETQVELRSASTQKNNERQDDLQPVRLDAYLAKVHELMASEEPETLAVAIAALTGRRFAEVVAVGRFTPTKHPYLVHFEGQQKKEGAIGFEVLSLVEARVLLPLIERFRSLPGVVDLVGRDDDDPQVQLFGNRVNGRVEKYFQKPGLVPIVRGFKSVSIHRLRAIYGAIAIHFWCANNQHVHRFLQNYLGHVLSGEVGVSNSRATDHYFHYYLTREDGTTPITARGVKLMANPLLPSDESREPQVEEVIPEVEEMVGEVINQEVEEVEYRKHSLLRIEFDSRDRWLRVLAQVCPDGRLQQEQSQVLLGWIEERLQEPVEAEPELPSQLSDLGWIKEQFEAMQRRLERLEQSSNVAELEEEIERLKMENERLKSAEEKLQQFRRLMAEGGEGSTNDHQAVAAQVFSGEPRMINSTPHKQKLTKSGGASDRAKAILLAIQEWNQIHPETTFAITTSLMKDTFGIHFEATKEFFKDYQNQIWELHQRSGVRNDRSHNRQNGQKYAIEEFKEFVKSRS